MEYFIFIVIGTAIVIALIVLREKKVLREHQEMLERLTPEGRAEYDKQIEEDRVIKEREFFISVYGNLNPELICPHCQSKGTVHAIQHAQDVVTTGKVGGILKTDIKTTTKNWMTQHHCIKCKTTWNV